MKHAFTMAEVLITIGIIGLLAAITMPMVTRSIPTKEEELHKKMSYLIEQIAGQLANNEAYYPRTNDIAKTGFQNTDEVTVDGVKYGGGTASSIARKQKFCMLFARQMNTMGPVVCSNMNVNSKTTSPSFKTSDGVDWWIPQTTFKETTNGQVKGFVKIKIDVNGYNNGGNCMVKSNTCRKPDTFYYYIKSNGAVTLNNPTAVADRTYQIVPNIVTRDADGNILSQVDGVASGSNRIGIAEIRANGTYGSFSTAAASFNNLDSTKNYMLRAQPTTNYLSNWSTKNSSETYGYKKVRPIKTKTEVPVEFKQIKKYCIQLKVDCPSGGTSCLASKQFRYNCQYIDVGLGNGDYSRPSANLDNYDYEAPGNGKGRYRYQCSSITTLSQHPTKTNYLQRCNLDPGDYMIYVTPTSGLKVFPSITGHNYYQQNVRLGTKDLEDFEVEVRY